MLITPGSVTLKNNSPLYDSELEVIPLTEPISENTTLYVNGIYRSGTLTTAIAFSEYTDTILINEPLPITLQDSTFIEIGGYTFTTEYNEAGTNEILIYPQYVDELIPQNSVIRWAQITGSLEVLTTSYSEEESTLIEVEPIPQSLLVGTKLLYSRFVFTPPFELWVSMGGGIEIGARVRSLDYVLGNTTTDPLGAGIDFVALLLVNEIVDPIGAGVEFGVGTEVTASIKQWVNLTSSEFLGLTVAEMLVLA